ncbi:hypothetical protein [Bacillus sp. AK128]
MKKKVWSILVLVIAVGIAIIVANQKPNDADFVRWMENTYEIKCLDYNCTTFEIESLEESGKELILMQTVQGSDSPGTFVKEADLKYRNLEDSSYYLDIHVKGFLGGFTVENENISKVPKK